MNRAPYTGWLLSFLFAIGMACAASAALAADLPVAEGSALAGISFEDHPLLLPVQRNFQMAMLTASSELGRSCGAIEAFGWRVAQNEQDRVNHIFNDAVNKLRAQGLTVESKAPNSVSRDITMFTADGRDKNLLFMWSAGEIGLVMVVCETSKPIGGRLGQMSEASPKNSFPQGSIAPRASAAAMQSPRHAPASAVMGLHDSLDTLPSHAGEAKRNLALSQALSRSGKRNVSFSPLGNWVGSYICAQGTTGGTLSITRVNGEHFEGSFAFYPTERNPTVPRGKYAVYGDYDAETQRILINPGKWIQHPKDFYNTIIIGSFDANAQTFSGYFQGITGCTSFEAHYRDGVGRNEGEVVKKPAHVKKKHITAHKKAPVEKTPAEAPAPVPAPRPRLNRHRLPLRPLRQLPLPPFRTKRSPRNCSQLSQLQPSRRIPSAPSFCRRPPPRQRRRNRDFS
jgi:hypothetical protein